MIRPEAENTMPEFSGTDWRAAVNALATNRYAVLRDALPSSAWMLMQEEARALLSAEVFVPARIGRADSS